MSFIYLPSHMRTPKIPGFSSLNGLWCGKGNDSGYIALYDNLWGGHIIVKDENLCWNLVIDNSIYTPVFTDINGYIYWEGNGYIYYSHVQEEWVLSYKFPGHEPVEKQVFEDGKFIWEGDHFYSVGTPPFRPDSVVTILPGGSLKNEGEKMELRAIWPRWVAKEGEFGEYEGTDGESGVRIKGLPRFKGNGEYFLRSLKRESGYFTYGRIRYTQGKWIIGEIGDSAGWHEGSEPNVGSGVTFKFMKNEDSEAQGSNISVSFDSYVCGDETETGYLGSAAIWR